MKALVLAIVLRTAALGDPSPRRTTEDDEDRRTPPAPPLPAQLDPEEMLGEIEESPETPPPVMPEPTSIPWIPAPRGARPDEPPLAA